MKIIETLWFNNIGIVLCTNDEGKPVAYIGAGDGINERQDKQYIADYGSHFTEYQADKILAHLHQKKEKKQP